MTTGSSCITQGLSSENADGYLVANPKDLLNTVPFHLAFRAEDGTDAQTNIILSEKLTQKGDTPLQDLRTNGNLWVLSTLPLWPYLNIHSLPVICRSSKYRFCFPGDSNAISEDTTLGSYIASIEKVGLFSIWHGMTKINVIIPGCRTLPHSEQQQQKRRLRHSNCSTDQTRPSDLRWRRYQREVHLCRPQHHYPTDISTKRDPTDMSEHDWNVVMLNNSLLHGMVYDPESKTLQPAREPGMSNLKHGCLSDSPDL